MMTSAVGSRRSEVRRSLSLLWLAALTLGLSHDVAAQPERVTIESRGWELAGDLLVPDSNELVPGVVMLNQAAGDRTPYAELARHLADRGIASLRLDLPGHGESINLGEFVPGQVHRDPIIWEADEHIPAILEYLRSHPKVDAGHLGVVGASYSGEEAAESGRDSGYAQAYVVLSPGSFSDESIAAIDSSGVPWLFIVAHEDPFLKKISANVREQSTTVELLVLPGLTHATEILSERSDLAERIAVWLARALE